MQPKKSGNDVNMQADIFLPSAESSILLILMKETIQDYLCTLEEQVSTKNLYGKISRTVTINIFYPQSCLTGVSNTFLKAWVSNGRQDLKKYFVTMLWEV